MRGLRKSLSSHVIVLSEEKRRLRRVMGLPILLIMLSLLSQTKVLALPADLAQESAVLSNTLSDGKATFYPEYSQFVEIPGDASLGSNSGVAVLMSMGGWAGGNTNNQYVAIYAVNKDLKLGNADKKYRLIAFRQVGGKGDRLFTTLRYQDKSLILSGFGYGDKDGLCCPSQPIELQLSLNARGNLEVSQRSQSQELTD